jgi:hypothetical protein
VAEEEEERKVHLVAEEEEERKVHLVTCEEEKQGFRLLTGGGGRTGAPTKLKG